MEPERSLSCPQALLVPIQMNPVHTFSSYFAKICSNITLPSTSRSSEQNLTYFLSQSSEFCRHNPLCCFSTSIYCCTHIFHYRISPDTFGYTLVSIHITFWSLRPYQSFLFVCHVAFHLPTCFLLKACGYKCIHHSVITYPALSIMIVCNFKL
jgi:hypothetical protein